MSELIGPGPNTLVERAKAIIMKPVETWPTIADEPATPGDLIVSYALPLIAIGPVAGFIGGQLFSWGLRPGIVASLTGAIIQFVLGVVGVIVFALIADWLAPKFDGQSNRTSAFKIAVYGGTAAWLAGIFGLIPLLGFLGLLGLYSIYLIYTGATPVMKVPQERAAGYTAVTIIAAAVLYVVVAAIGTAVTTAVVGVAALTGVASSEDSGGEVTLPGLGTIDTKKMEEAAKKMEEATKGEAKSVALADLQALLPASLGAYQRTAVASAGAGSMGEAEGTYTSGDKTIRLKIVDMSGLGALAGLGSAMGVEQSREDANGYERTGTVDGAMQSEKWNRTQGRGSFGRSVANRFMVEAEGEAGSIDELKAAVAAVDQDKLAGLAE